MHDMGISPGLTCFSLIDRRRSDGGAERDEDQESRSMSWEMSKR
jgi:hypothetical protein